MFPDPTHLDADGQLESDSPVGPPLPPDVTAPPAGLGDALLAMTFAAVVVGGMALLLLSVRPRRSAAVDTPSPPPRATYYVGNKELDKDDRLVLATWSGQVVPARGSVYLELTAAERTDLVDVFGMLHVDRGRA
jgi:hypothetical protein